jgi:hypothetical protein
MSTKSLLLMPAALVLCAAASAGAETPYGTADRPLAGPRYVTLRAMSEHLAQTAKGALEATDDEARRGNSSAARLVSTALSFARDSHEFHRVLGGYQRLPFDVPVALAGLATAAQEANESVRAARGMQNTYEDWQAILDVLERMRLLLAGDDVLVPAPHVVAALSGLRLLEFRELAAELATSANRAHESAKRDLGEYPSRGQQFLGELYYFAVQIRGLSQKSHAEINPQKFGPLVDGLLDDARQADRRMRDAQVFRSVWDDSGHSITILHRMANLVRS